MRKLFQFCVIRRSHVLPLSILICLSFAGVRGISAQTTVYTYTGQLKDAGNPANGNYDMTFSLFDALSGGTQVGSTITINSVPVSAGVFAVQLDFGAAAFSGGGRFLEVKVANTVLSPRSQITSAPYAIRALTAQTAQTATSVTGPITGTDPVATLSISNAQTGISNSSPANLPPAALRAEATSTINSNAGLIGIADGSTGLGIIGISNGNAPLNGQGNAVGVIGITTATSGKSVGVFGLNNSPDGIGVEAQSVNGAALFVGGNDTTGEVFSVDSLGRVGGRSFSNQNQSFVADRFGNIAANGINVGPAGAETFVVQPSGAVSAKSLFVGQNGTTFTVNNGDLGVNGSLTVTGSFSVTGAKNSIVKLHDGQWVALSAMESPGTWFEDFGTIRLRNGRAFVQIDATFAQTANVGTPYMVYVTPGGNCRGLYVTRKTAAGFEVREIGGGHSNVSFDYRIVAKRRGYENVRFAPVPKAAQPR